MLTFFQNYYSFYRILLEDKANFLLIEFIYLITVLDDKQTVCVYFNLLFLNMWPSKIFRDKAYFCVVEGWNSAIRVLICERLNVIRMGKLYVCSVFRGVDGYFLDLVALELFLELLDGSGEVYWVHRDSSLCHLAIYWAINYIKRESYLFIFHVLIEKK